jgi:hypothetical protein
MVDKVPVLVSRSWQLANLSRDFEILLDGKPAARVRNGKTIAVQAPLGEHELVAQIDWCRSPPVRLSLRPDSEACLRVRCAVPRWAWLVPYLVFLYIMVPGWYLAIEPA